MKKLFLLLCLFTGFAATSFAQLGKMQFQDAEEQFAGSKFKEALDLLDKSEKSLGKTNAMIEHLRIMARTELLKQDIFENVDQLEPARKEAASFLQKYGGDSRIEDKYREVYQASKTLSSFPSKVMLEKQKVEQAKLEEAKEELGAISFLPNYRDGMTVEEIKAAIPGFQSELNTDSTLYLNFDNGKYSVFVSKKSRRSFGYVITESYTNKDRICSITRTAYDNKKAAITQQLGVEPLNEKPATTGQDVNSRLQALMLTIQMDYVTNWQKSTKLLRLVFDCQGQKRNTVGRIILSSENTAYK